MAVGLIVAIVIVIVLVAILIPLGMWIGRRARGSLELQVPNRHLRPGETIEGMVQLTAKRDLGPGRLFTSLVCTEEWWEWETDHDGDRTREKKRREVYRDDLDLQRELAMTGGSNQVFPFALPTPYDDRSEPAPQATSTWGRLVSALGEMTRRDSEFIWEVEARYDIPGLDLKASERINLHLEL